MFGRTSKKELAARLLEAEEKQAVAEEKQGEWRFLAEKYKRQVHSSKQQAERYKQLLEWHRARAAEERERREVLEGLLTDEWVQHE
jgi:hypothetical protein